MLNLTSRVNSQFAHHCGAMRFRSPLGYLKAVRNRLIRAMITKQAGN